MLKLNNIENENAGYEIISVGLTVIKQKKIKRKKEIETRKKSVNWTDLSKKKKKSSYPFCFKFREGEKGCRTEWH